MIGVDNKTAVIVPLAHLDAIRQDDYFMSLSYACTNSTYVAFFRERAREGKFVMLDNSTIETGAPEANDDYIRKAIDMEASMVVLPDWFQDRVRTIDEGREFKERAIELGFRGRFMGVPQGKDIPEWRRCADVLATFSDVLGVSYRYNDMFSGHREIGTLIASMAGFEFTAKYRPVHLLGCHGNPRTEVSHLLQYWRVRGVDSSFAALITKYGKSIDDRTVRSPHTMIDILNDEYPSALLRYNIDRWRKMCNGHFVSARDDLNGPSLSS